MDSSGPIEPTRMMTLIQGHESILGIYLQKIIELLQFFCCRHESGCGTPTCSHFGLCRRNDRSKSQRGSEGREG